MIAGYIDNTIYYITNVGTTNDITPRPTQLTTLNKTTLNANGVDEIVISNAPIGATCIITDGATAPVLIGTIDGIDTFSTDIPETYQIKISLWPYIDFTAIINAI
jgi:hypothetical protein